MKNIQSMALNCVNIHSSFSIMKKYIFILVLCALTVCTLVGCKNDSSSEPDTLAGDVSEPAWTFPEEHDYSSSMTAVVKVDLTASYPKLAKDFVLTEKDRLAAFAGSTCMGVAYPKDGLFFLYIAPMEPYTGEVTLRYYSAHYKNLFEVLNAFPFANDARLGTVAEPFTPQWIVSRNL